jgi:quercetin dioxygenase-like cupin family protein
MRLILTISIFFAFAFSMSVMAQEPAKAAPNSYKTIFENERVRVHEVNVKPGDKVPTHSHPDHFAYAMSACTLSITPEGGKAETVETKAGQVLWLNAVTHSAENPGKTECKLLVVDLKK